MATSENRASPDAKGPGQRASGTVLVVRKTVVFPGDLGQITFQV